MFYLLSFFWLIRETKAILFWLYLWQLKEYHIGRFIDHFRTDKGKKLFLNPLFFLKFLILVFFFILSALSTLYLLSLLTFLLLLIYLLETTQAFKSLLKKNLKSPVLTVKTTLLITVALVFEIFFLILSFPLSKSLPFFLLIFDILTPVIVSGIVLIFQPLAVLERNHIIQKAKKKREQFKNLIVIGITGSYGKTSTKEFLATILSKKYNVLKTKEHQNSEVGVSQCILNDLKEDHEIFICEMGAYNRGGIKLLCDIVKPKIGIVTGVNEQHLATFGTMENLLSAEGGIELIDSLPEDGIAFFNAKNKYCQELYQKTKIKKFLYGESVELAGMENIEGAKKVAKELGLSEEEIERASQKIGNKFPGIELKKGINGINIIDATYSANPDGVIAHLEYLKTFSGKKLIVMPCLIELGKATIEVHKRIGEKIGQVCNLAIITTKDRFKEIRETAGEKAVFIENPKEIFEKIRTFCKPGDVILLESRIPYQLIDFLIKK